MATDECAEPGRTGRWLALCLLVFALGGCQQRDTADNKPPAKGASVWLTLVGYNYTDHYIDNYYVNGTWGGNVFLSSSDSGGSKYTCCVRWRVGRSLPAKVHVRWESSACVYTKRVEGEDFIRAKAFYTDEDIWLEGPVPDDPQYFETHIYPDGHVEVAITSEISPPRLKLPVENHWRPGAERWPECTPAQMRAGAR